MGCDATPDHPYLEIIGPDDDAEAALSEGPAGPPLFGLSEVVVELQGLSDEVQIGSPADDSRLGPLRAEIELVCPVLNLVTKPRASPDQWVRGGDGWVLAHAGVLVGRKSLRRQPSVGRWEG